MQTVRDTYALAFHRSMTFRDLFGHSIYFSTAEIYPNVELIQNIHATDDTPALYELILTINGERKVIIVHQENVELRRNDQL